MSGTVPSLDDSPYFDDFLTPASSGLRRIRTDPIIGSDHFRPCKSDRDLVNSLHLVLRLRGGHSILKDLCTFDAMQASQHVRLPHDCYMIFVGRLADSEQFDKLKHQASSMDHGEGFLPNLSMMETEEFELFLEYVTLINVDNVEDLADDRCHHFVYEDHFNPFLFNMMKSESSFKKLKNVCQHYETKEGVDVEIVMDEHKRRTAASSPYFIQKGLSTDDAQAAAFALSFYTGTKSEACNRGASLVARQANGQAIESTTRDELNEAAVILYYLVKALSCIPYYWGYVTRACELTDDELKLYMPGCLITWIQFSSSKKGKSVAANFDFQTRNTHFKIYSLTGRPIKEFSNYSEEEDEVLFLPHSTFFVFRHDLTYHGKQHTIYMRQVEMGLSKLSILWVDDNIYNPNWENKYHMENAAAKELNQNVHFIPKSSTDSALSFLRSPFGQRLKNKDTFRIITDMNRENERPTHNAGARLIKAIRQMGFKNQCMVFTSDKRRGDKIIESELNAKEKEFVTVTATTDDLQNFVNFDERTKSTHDAVARNFEKFDEFKQFTHHQNDQNFYKPKSATVESNQGATVENHPEIYTHMKSHMPMHNPMNTNVDILLMNCTIRTLANSRHNCILITTGSFNPIHRAHFTNLLHVQQHLENKLEPSWNVLAGYLSPTHDSYVHSKLGDSGLIPAKDRCKLGGEAIEYFEEPEISSWITVSRGESEWHDGFVDFGPVSENLRDFLNDTLVQKEKLLKYPLRVVYVCGLDHFNKCPDVETLAQRINMACAVVYRPGEDEQRIRRAAKSPNVIYIPLTDQRDTLSNMSSTQIRQYFKNPTAGAEPFIYPNVHDYMRKRYQN